MGAHDPDYTYTKIQNNILGYHILQMKEKPISDRMVTDSFCLAREVVLTCNLIYLLLKHLMYLRNHDDTRYVREDCVDIGTAICHFDGYGKCGGVSCSVSDSKSELVHLTRCHAPLQVHVGETCRCVHVAWERFYLNYITTIV